MTYTTSDGLSWGLTARFFPSANPHLGSFLPSLLCVVNQSKTFASLLCCLFGIVLSVFCYMLRSCVLASLGLFLLRSFALCCTLLVPHEPADSVLGH